MNAPRRFLIALCFGISGSWLASADPAPVTVKHVYVATDFSCVLFSDFKTVKCWGNGAHGNLGYSAKTWGDRPGQMGKNLKPVDLGGQKIRNLSLGGTHACALLENGQVWCWGDNKSGILGALDFDGKDSVKPVRVSISSKVKFIAAGEGHNCVITDKNEIFCWGENGSGQIFPNDYTTRSKAENAITATLKPLQDKIEAEHKKIKDRYERQEEKLSRRFDYSSVDREKYKLLSDQLRKARDEDEKKLDVLRKDASDKRDKLRQSNPLLSRAGKFISKEPIAASEEPVELALGSSSSCVLLKSGKIRCWGGSFISDKFYEVVPFGDLRALRIRAANSRVCGLFVSGANAPAHWKCWGADYSGLIGDGKIASNNVRPDQGDVPDLFDPNSEPLELYLGFGNTCALLPGYILKCFGYNSSGISAPSAPTYALGSLAIGTPVYGTDDDFSIPFGPGLRPLEVAVGNNHACAIVADYNRRPSDKGVKCWGSRNNGVLGFGTKGPTGSVTLTAAELEAEPFLDLQAETAETP